MDSQLHTPALAVVIVLALVAAVAASLQVVAYWQGNSELILPAVAVAIVALLAIKVVLILGRG